MEKLLLITGALMVGGCFGFFLAACLLMGIAPHPDPLPEGEGMLTPTPEEIVAVYEARRKMEKRQARGDRQEAIEDDLIMVDYFPMSRKALKGWEKEQDRKEKRRMR